MYDYRVELRNINFRIFKIGCKAEFHCNLLQPICRFGRLPSSRRMLWQRDSREQER